MLEVERVDDCDVHCCRSKKTLPYTNENGVRVNKLLVFPFFTETLHLHVLQTGLSSKSFLCIHFIEL